MGEFLTVELRRLTGESLGVLVAGPKKFKTGSRGFHGQTKIAIDGARYQVQVQAVEIGSKEKEGTG